MLLPREHGTYGEVLFPLVSALILGTPNPGVWGLVAVTLGGYLAHEGVIVLSGWRGPRAAREQRGLAWRSVAVFGGLALMGAAVAAPSLTRDAWVAAAAVAAASLVALGNAVRGAEHSLGGEVLAAIVLPAWAVPAGLQGGMAWAEVLPIWGAWVAGYVGATGVVHVIIARTRQQPLMRPLLVAVAGAAAGPFVSLAAVPLSVATLLMLGLPVTARSLRRVGWSVIAASVATLVWTIR